MIRTPKRSARRRNNRKGAIAVLAAIFLVVLFVMVAFAVDFGYVLVAQTELQRAADAAAHAAVLEYRIRGDAATAIATARSVASDYALDNPVTKSGAAIDKNINNEDINGDVVVGNYSFDTHAMTFGNIGGYNAVRVRVRRTAAMNGAIPLFFARVIGQTGIPIEAEATAALIKDVSGFKIPPSGERVPFLPITIRKEYWEQELQNLVDNLSWDPITNTANNIGDGIPEVQLYPSDVTSAGNFGTLNVGTSTNSTQHVSDVIQNGLTQEMLDFHGGDLSFDDSGELILTGDTGLSAGMKDDLEAIIGKPSVIPLFANVENPGNTAVFTIVQFIGVRVMEVRLTGRNKGVIIQPSGVTFAGVISSPTASSGFDTGSYQVYSPVAIVK